MTALPPFLRERGERAADTFSDLPASARDDAVRVFALSDFAEGAAVRQTEWFLEALGQERFADPFTAVSLADDSAAMLPADGTMAPLQQGLRRLRQRYQLWLVWRHCLGSASLEDTLAGATLLADALIDAALCRLYQSLCRERGTPTGRESGKPQRLVVIALGKLGARELNLSSDVDLMFCFPEAGITVAAEGGRAGEQNQQFFLRLGQQLITALDPVTVDGFVFRVDMRLRPYGSSGPLAVDFAAVEDYYATQGRDWERYALMKARVAAGDLEAGAELLNTLSSFTFRRYLDFGAIDSLRAMKARLVAERQHLEDVKLGPGGIRDIEFSAQMQQMIWGGREPALRTPTLLPVLSTLGELGHFQAQQVERLTDAYRFLRNTEHSLQAEDDRQTQRLPTSELSQARLAATLDFPDYSAFLEVLDGHRQSVAEVFDGLLGESAVDAAAGLRVWQHAGDPEVLPEVLATLGFGDGNALAEALGALALARDRGSVSADAKNRLDRLMPELIEDALALPAPTLALTRALPVLRAVLRRSAYLALLSENPSARRHLLELVSASFWLATSLAEHPAFFDALLDERALTVVPDRAALAGALAEDLARHEDDFEHALEVLREFKSHHVFNVALAELRGTLSLMRVSDALTWLAEAVLEEALTLAWRDNLTRFPEYADRRPFLIVGYGKLGGIELGPGSDLDIVFIHDLPTSASQFLHRLVRRLLHVLTAPTYNGSLYEIDTRLRPSGNAGTMVSSLDAFVDYQQNQAWVWEHQALVRARPVAGDPALARRFAAARRELLAAPRELAALKEAVLTMRERMRAQLPRDAEAMDLKRGSGGIVDIEFVVQYLVLAHAHAHPALTEFTDNVRILDAVEAAQLLPAQAAARLKEAYLALRAEWHRTVLDIPDSERAARTLSRYREDVSAIWQGVFDDGQPG
ncbi:MAG: bifunctional [glutamate--ammonia ligase]-adenylyl-L-tyrosine phosphorylase/[glutamate--ammonia-ligase] adenylyltransferase [Pseudomonadota bacterium]